MEVSVVTADRLTAEQIDEAFDWQRHLRHIDVFYQRLGIAECSKSPADA